MPSPNKYAKHAIPQGRYIVRGYAKPRAKWYSETASVWPFISELRSLKKHNHKAWKRARASLELSAAH